MIPQPTFVPKAVPVLQGAYYSVFGLLSLLNISAFQALTGPKTDIWLVKTVGLLLVVAGLVMLSTLFRRRTPLEVAALGSGCALALAGVDVVYVSIGTIAWIYLLDALAEIIILVGWIFMLRRYRGAFM